MHGPHNVFDIGHCTFIHCDAGDVSLVDQLKAEKTDIRLKVGFCPKDDNSVQILFLSFSV